MAKLDNVTHCAEPLEKLESMRKNRIVLKRLGQMVQLDGIWLDGLT